MNSLVAASLLIPWLCYAIASVALVDYFRRDWKRHTLRRPRPAEPPPKAAIILPIKGCPSHLPAALDAYCGLDYPDYELVIAVEEGDAAAESEARRAGEAMPARVRVVVAGRTRTGSQKTANQLAAWDALDSAVEIVCFADADTVPPTDWLRCLADWISTEPGKALVSGYRWFVPQDLGLATLFACAINNAIAMAPRDRRWNLPWGGAMAAHRLLLDKLDLGKVLQGVASDDLVLGEAVRRHGGYVEQIRDLLVPSPVSYGWLELIEFIRRQYTMTWLYARKHWGFAAAVTTLAAAGWIAAFCLAAQGHAVVYGIILAVYAVGILGAYRRLRFAMDKWPDSTPGPSSKPVFWAQALAAPLLAVFHAACVLLTFKRTTFTWAGVSYDAADPRRVIATRPRPTSLSADKP